MDWYFCWCVCNWFDGGVSRVVCEWVVLLLLCVWLFVLWNGVVIV